MHCLPGSVNDTGLKVTKIQSNNSYCAQNIAIVPVRSKIIGMRSVCVKYGDLAAFNDWSHWDTNRGKQLMDVTSSEKRRFDTTNVIE